MSKEIRELTRRIDELEKLAHELRTDLSKIPARWLYEPSAEGGGLFQPVIIKSATTNDDGTTGAITVRKVRYAASPPQAGKVEEYGDTFAAFPWPGSRYLTHALTAYIESRTLTGETADFTVKTVWAAVQVPAAGALAWILVAILKPGAVELDPDVPIAATTSV